MSNVLLKNVLGACFRANPEYQLVLFDRLPPDQQDALRNLTKDPDFYGVLQPLPGSTLTTKSVCRDTALLLFTLNQPAPLPSYVPARLGDEANQAVAELVLDGVLQMESDGRFICGSEAYNLIYEDRQPPAVKGKVQQLTQEALEYAQALDIDDSSKLSARLYFYNRIPLSPYWKRRLPGPEAVASYLGIDSHGANRRFLDGRWSRMKVSPSSEGWFHWESRAGRGTTGQGRQGYKLYVSPHPECVADAFAAVVEVLSQSQAHHFKAGNDVSGLLRSDKIVVYFWTLEDLQATAQQLATRLEGCDAQGVPFTAAIEESGLLSWGIDPLPDTGVLEWQEKESWRLWVTNRLATALLMAKSAQNGTRLEPWRYALERLRLENVDTDTWIPQVEEVTMQMTDPMILPADMLLVPVKDLPDAVRQQVQAEEGDFALTRPHSRTPSRIVDADSAKLLNEFRSPSTIVEAVIRYSREKQSDPAQTLEEAFPMLERLAKAHLLVPSESEEAQRIEPSLKPGDTILGAEVLRSVQSLEDTELFKVKLADGSLAALKILRTNANAQTSRMYDREAAILGLLDGGIAPKLLNSGAEGGRRYLLIEWCPGVACSAMAADLRKAGGAESRRRLAQLCGAILDAYSQLHSRNVIHSDVHPLNVLVDTDLRVKLIDFGLARIGGVENEFRRAPRGGIGFFFEPEYARAMRSRQQIPASSLQGEQFALGALLYFLITGSHYLDFSIEKHEMFRQIAEDAPLEFAKRGVDPWPEVEPVLAKALSKHASDRFATVADFAAALRVDPPVEEDATKDYPEAKEVLGNMSARLGARGELFASGLTAAPKVSLTYGSAGVAFGLYRIACARDDAASLALADLWATRAARQTNASDAFYCPDIQITTETVGRISPYHTVSGLHLTQAVIGQAMGDVVSQQTALDNYLMAVKSAPCESLDVTLGQAGTILGAALLLDSIAGNAYVDSAPLLEFGNEALSQLWSRLQSFAPIRECREISYSGAAHGWAGILYALMTWCDASRSRLPEGLDDRLDQLAKLADHSGRRARWKYLIRARSNQPGGVYMPGWCNGSAGFVFLWTLAHRMLDVSKYRTLAEKAGFDTWESEGEIGNLCCGFAGQAYALLNLYKHTGDKAWLNRARAFTEQAAKATREMPPGPAYHELLLRAESLYKGELGVAVLAAEMERPETASMPFFEREI